MEDQSTYVYTLDIKEVHVSGEGVIHKGSESGSAVRHGPDYMRGHGPREVVLHWSDPQPWPWAVTVVSSTEGIRSRFNVTEWR